MAKQGERPVLVADSDDAFRERVVNVLRRAGLSAAGARGGEEALELADVDGFEVCHELRERHGEDLPVIMVSRERVTAHDRIAGLLIGADDYLVKPVNDDELLARLRRLLLRTGVASGARQNGSEQVNGLSPREVEVLRLLAQGVAAESIADRLVISRKTVSSHLQRVMSKLGVHTRAQAVAQAYRIGLVTGDFEAHSLLEVENDGGRLAPPPVAVP